MKNEPRINLSAAGLWASAFVIMALIIVQAGKLPVNQAMAGTSTSESGFTVLTANSGTGGKNQPNELLYIIDNRHETLLVYEIDDPTSKQILLRDGGSLRNLFAGARR